jgi:hypothetical protein
VESNDGELIGFLVLESRDAIRKVRDVDAHERPVGADAGLGGHESA